MGDSLGEVTIVGEEELPSEKVGIQRPACGAGLEGVVRTLPWVARATHGRSHRRPTVGFDDDLP